jgi:hypothetical protein
MTAKTMTDAMNEVSLTAVPFLAYKGGVLALKAVEEPGCPGFRDTVLDRQNSCN